MKVQNLRHPKPKNVCSIGWDHVPVTSKEIPCRERNYLPNMTRGNAQSSTGGSATARPFARSRLEFTAEHSTRREPGVKRSPVARARYMMEVMVNT